MGNSGLVRPSLFMLTSSVSMSLPSHIPIPIPVLRDKAYKALRKLGHDHSDSEIISEVLLYAELRDNNQGVIKLISGGLDFNEHSSPVRVVLETPVSAKIDGGQRIGMTVVAKGVEMAVDKAKKQGISIVACSNYSSATGALGFWSRKITNAGLIGIVMSQCNEMVAPYGTYEKIFGTNPISIGIPTLPRSQILDMATSAIAYYGLKIAEQEGKDIPSDVAYTSSGLTTTNPTEALKGAIRVFDRGYKGSHLSLMVELLAGSLTGASMLDKEESKNWGSLVIVIDPSVLGSKEEFLEKAMEMCNRVKNSSKLLEGFEEVYLPGERGDLLEEKNLSKGFLEMSGKTFEMLREMSKEEKE